MSDIASNAWASSRRSQPLVIIASADSNATVTHRYCYVTKLVLFSHLEIDCDDRVLRFMQVSFNMQRPAMTTILALDDGQSLLLASDE